MIAERIYRGEPAEQIGIGRTEYNSRRQTLDRYLKQSGGQFDKSRYLAWLQKDQAGNRTAAGSSADAEWDMGRPSRGFGDTIAKVTHRTGLVKIAEAYTRITGKDCGCGRRQARLNKLLPYKIERV